MGTARRPTPPCAVALQSPPRALLARAPARHRVRRWLLLLVDSVLVLLLLPGRLLGRPIDAPGLAAWLIVNLIVPIATTPL